MINKIINDLLGKKIVILGFGLEGKSTYEFIRRYCDIPLTIADKNIEILENKLLKDDRNLNLLTGENYLNNLDEFDLILKSPGIFLDNKNLESKITSQLNLVLKYHKEKIIGVTGTKGKSTTSSLIYEAIKSCGEDVLLLGNIGNPILSQIENIKENTFLVIECSAHQLQYIERSPKISVITNLLEDHLDFFKTVKNYHLMKLNIFKYQEETDSLVYLKECSNITNYLNNDFLSQRKVLEYKVDYGMIGDKKYNVPDMKIIGDNNKKNALLALVVCDSLNLNLEKASVGIANFNGLEHRMEFAGKYNDIYFYNDVIATIPEATISAVESLKIVDTLIIGGMDRKINYDILIDFLNSDKVNNLVCMPTTGHNIANSLKSDLKMNIYKVNDMQEAVDISKKVTEKNKICLLSPAASSYEFYKDFKEKGKHFKELISK